MRYENIISRIEAAAHKDWPEWMGKIDFTGLKLKLMSSIVAISAVQLLKSFMNIGKISDRDLAWYVGIHLVFVVSGLSSPGPTASPAKRTTTRQRATRLEESHRRNQMWPCPGHYEVVETTRPATSPGLRARRLYARLWRRQSGGPEVWKEGALEAAQ